MSTLFEVIPSRAQVMEFECVRNRRTYVETIYDGGYPWLIKAVMLTEPTEAQLASWNAFLWLDPIICFAEDEL